MQRIAIWKYLMINSQRISKELLPTRFKANNKKLRSGCFRALFAWRRLFRNSHLVCPFVLWVIHREKSMYVNWMSESALFAVRLIHNWKLMRENKCKYGNGIDCAMLTHLNLATRMSIKWWISISAIVLGFDLDARGDNDIAWDGIRLFGAIRLAYIEVEVADVTCPQASAREKLGRFEFFVSFSTSLCIELKWVSFRFVHFDCGQFCKTNPDVVSHLSELRFLSRLICKRQLCFLEFSSNHDKNTKIKSQRKRNKKKKSNEIVSVYRKKVKPQNFHHFSVGRALDSIESWSRCVVLAWAAHEHTNTATEQIPNELLRIRWCVCVQFGCVYKTCGLRARTKESAHDWRCAQEFTAIRCINWQEVQRHSLMAAFA